MYMITQIVRDHGRNNWIFSITTPKVYGGFKHVTGHYKNMWTEIQYLNLIQEIKYNEQKWIKITAYSFSK